MNTLPAHLRKYIVEQDYNKYTPVDHAVWRYVLRQLRAFLGQHAHESYMEGLKKTGIEIERIPRIEDISKKLQAFGWQALPVSGFIPPAAFMELQSLGVLPIASDMRSLEHLKYTPAPDIVHEAAGHAPILIQPEFAEYLRQYAQVARKAIINQQDLKQYEAIRILSDLKEHHESTAEQIAAANATLDEVNRNMGDISEAGELSRMNWWTAEYGLIGPLDNPKIYGAGLLSSVGEAAHCLSDKVKKLPLTVDCIKQTYDITEPQPQLFVTPSFAHLSEVLQQMANGMAFKQGGKKSYQKAVSAKSVNTIELNSGLQISGQWSESIWNGEHAVFVKATGPCQISYQDQEMPNQGTAHHTEGFSTPLGSFAEFPGRCPSTLTEKELGGEEMLPGQSAVLKMSSGFEIHGTIKHLTRKDGKLLMITWADCRATYQGRTYYEPAWGTFDQVIGLKITSVFGGPADSSKFGDRDDFVAARVPTRKFTETETRGFDNYQSLRKLRESKVRDAELLTPLKALIDSQRRNFPKDWLLPLEALELTLSRIQLEGPAGVDGRGFEADLRKDLANLVELQPLHAESIRGGLSLASQLD